MVRAVLFDLDDTLFDHRLCARTALSELHGAHAGFQGTTLDDFERLHAGFLEKLHQRVLNGELPLDEARRERFRRLFEAVGLPADDETIAAAAATYREGYRKVWQPVAGARRLLELVKRRARIGVVSNNLVDEQVDKLRHCGFADYIDDLTVSENAGVSKPDPEIFRISLRRLQCGADAAVMVGDSWAADIVGARAAGIRAIWFNPSGKPVPEPDAGVTILRSLEPPEEPLAAIFGERVGGDGATKKGLHGGAENTERDFLC
jgi:putative hydrolase of the HAD superfamily